MRTKTRDIKPVLPGNHGQFGESVATEAFVPLRATQRVPVRPVVPRQSANRTPAKTSSTQRRD